MPPNHLAPAALTARLDAWLDEITRPSGTLVITAPTGSGVVPILERWLAGLRGEGEVIVEIAADRAAAGAPPEDRAEALAERLAAAIEALYPDFVDRLAHPRVRLPELLQRLSRGHLAPPTRRLLLVVTGLDRLRGRDDDDNPLPRLLTAALPRGVSRIVTLDPRSPRRPWLERLAEVEIVEVAAGEGATAEAAPEDRSQETGPQGQVSPDDDDPLGGRLDAGDLVGAWSIARDLDRLATIVRARGLGRLLADLDEAAARADDPARRRGFDALSRAITDDGAWIRQDPGRLAPLVLGRLLDQGWSAAEIDDALVVPASLPLRRVLPLASRDRADAVLYGHEGPVKGVAVAPDGSTIASVSSDGTLKLWDLPRRRERLSLCAHTGPINACAFTPDGGRVISASDDGTLICWDVDTGCPVNTLVGHSAGVEAVAVRSDGAQAASVAADGALHLWDLEGGAVVASCTAHEFGATAVALAPDGSFVATGSHDKTVRIWGLPGLEPGPSLSGPEYAVSGLSIDPTSERVLASAYDNVLRLWSARSGEPLHELWGHASWVTSCAIDRTGARALSTSRDGSLRLWDLEGGGELSALVGHAGMVNTAALTPDGRGAVSGGHDRTLRIWTLPREGVDAAILGHEGPVRAVLFAGDGATMLSGGVDATVRAWDRRTGEELGQFLGHMHGVSGLALTPAGDRLITSALDRTLKIWSVKRRLVEATLTGHPLFVHDCALSPDGATIVSASQDKTLRLWTLAGEPLRTLEGHQKDVLCCRFDAQGRVFSGGADAMIRAWDPQSGRELMTFAGHDGAVNACAITADGALLISGSADGTVKLWNLRRGREKATLRGHEGPITGVALTGDGRLLTTSEDRGLRLWSLESGACLASLHGNHAFTALTADARQALAGDAAGNLWLIDLGPA
ncbi:MAG: WD40 repeat domain-containing protein [Nannocystaceae bacterium]